MTDFFADRKDLRDRSILVLGDIHGNFEAYSAATKFADDNKLFIVSLGDIVDYGAASAAVIWDFAGRVNRGDALMILGNHERKMTKYFTQVAAGNVRVQIGKAQQATIDSFEGRTEIIARFQNLCAASSGIVKIGKTVFTHGAISARFWFTDPDKVSNNRVIENDAFFGQIIPHQRADDGFPVRIYDWVNAIPADFTVMVGHDPRSFGTPFVDTNKDGGKAVFLDTGCSKVNLKTGEVGHLSGAVLKDGAFTLVEF